MAKIVLFVKMLLHLEMELNKHENFHLKKFHNMRELLSFFV